MVVVFQVATKQDLLSLQSEINEKVYSSTLRYGEGFRRRRGAFFDSLRIDAPYIYVCRVKNFETTAPSTPSRKSAMFFSSTL